MFLGAILGSAVFYIIPFVLLSITSDSMYNRNPMDEYLWADVYGDLMISDALTELTVVSYSMTNQEARLYSKYMAMTDPDIYDMRLFDAACATSAAPAYWQLKCTPHPCDDIVPNAEEGKPSIC